MAELIASGTSETTSSDIVVGAGQVLTVYLVNATDSPAVDAGSTAFVQVKGTTAGKYFNIERLDRNRPFVSVPGPGTFRVKRRAAGAAFAVDGGVTSYAAVSATTITRPNDTAVYASGDLVANSTTAGSVVPGQIVLPSNAFCIPKLRLRKSGTGVTNAAFSIHLFKATVGVSNGDNGVFTPSAMANWLGSFDITSMRAFADGAVGNGVPTVGPAISDELAFGSNTLYYLIEAKGAYTPTAQEVFTVILELY